MKLKNGLTPKQTARAILLDAAFQCGIAPQEKLGFELTQRQEEELLRYMGAEYKRVQKLFGNVMENVINGDWSEEKED